MSVTNAISSIICIGALVQIAPGPWRGSAGRTHGYAGWPSVSIALTAVNMFGGFAVTQRMLDDVPQIRGHTEMSAVLSSELATVSYIGATILFILSLGGLSNPETSRRGNLYGMIGMTIAVLATVFGPARHGGRHPWIIGPWWSAARSACMRQKSSR
jgi:hypothetical protein